MTTERITLTEFVNRLMTDYPEVFEEVADMKLFDGAEVMCKKLGMGPPDGSEVVEEHLYKIISEFDKRGCCNGK